MKCESLLQEIAKYHIVRLQKCIQLSQFTFRNVYIYDIVTIECMILDGVWIGERIYRPLIHST